MTAQLPPNAPPPAAVLMASHVLGIHAEHKAGFPNSPPPPLFIGVQGPQGSGKTYLTTALVNILTSPAHALRVALLSTDDLYLPRSGLLAVAAAAPSNKMLQGRGLPGTHDIALGEQILTSLESATEGTTVHLPIFDKSAHGGLGDRSESTIPVEGPVDVVLLEGWSLGFLPISKDALIRKYAIARAEESVRSAKLGENDSEEDPEQAGLDDGMKGEEKGPSFLAHELESLLEINENLRAYDVWNKHFKAFIQISPPSLETIYKWRTQQEQDLRARTGKSCMSDAEIIAFVDRYMPAYELFLEGVRSPTQCWAGQGMSINLGESREVLGTGKF